ncbi:tyrosine-protein phosphatase [Nesterenkonia flava]|uniref:Tyrosine-protein phosphatase n=1 Tax=Nesterenkonia flava TaxID=469799 RepID=A0ABU1FPY5_9MICC|nr:tyrosine-protein phosphatase [Nesterenkonia flava]MDR5710705.1 tyrosine-protein phosphatase [Nesterenkonia flava]
METSIALEIPGTFNARVTATDSAGAPWLIRSAALDGVTEAGARRLQELGVTTVIDLREPLERQAPDALGAGHPGRPAIRTQRVPLYQLPDGPPATGSLREVYRFLLTERRDRLALAVRSISEAPGVALVHCAVGKDRTGLVTALTRLAAGDELPEILEDYELSGAQMPAAHHDRVRAALNSQGLDEETLAASLAPHTQSPSDALADVLQELIIEHGSVEDYLRSRGLPEAALESLRQKETGR